MSIAALSAGHVAMVAATPFTRYVTVATSPLAVQVPVRFTTWPAELQDGGGVQTTDAGHTADVLTGGRARRARGG